MTLFVNKVFEDVINGSHYEIILDLGKALNLMTDVTWKDEVKTVTEIEVIFL